LKEILSNFKFLFRKKLERKSR